jgi:hypothetical protein
LKSRICALQRQGSKSKSRVDKLEKAKTSIIENKSKRDEVKVKRKELQISKVVEVEVKKVRVIQQRKVEEERPKKVKEDVIR